MLTKNWNEYVAASLICYDRQETYTIPSISNNYVGLGNFFNTDGEKFSALTGETTAFPSCFSTFCQSDTEKGISTFDDANASLKGGACGLFILVGGGLTTPTLNDYKLENFIKLDPTSQVLSLRQSKDILTISRTFQNNTGENVTINEVGLYCNTVYDTADLATNYTVLLGREVIDLPITIEEGAMYTFTFSVGQ